MLLATQYGDAALAGTTMFELLEQDRALHDQIAALTTLPTV